jgi:hypothetical protein
MRQVRMKSNSIKCAILGFALICSFTMVSKAESILATDLHDADFYTQGEAWNLMERSFNQAERDPVKLLRIANKSFNCELVNKKSSVSMKATMVSKFFGRAKEMTVFNDKKLELTGQMIADNTRDANNQFDGLIGEFSMLGTALDGTLRGIFEDARFAGFILKLDSQGPFGSTKFYLACEN